MAGVVLFHSMQADWHALQPMHFDTSISLATGVNSRSGGGRCSVAERRTRSPGPRFSTKPSVGGLLIAVRGLSNILVPHRWRRRLDVHQERLVFGRLDIGVTDEGRERVRGEAFPRRAGE